MPKLFRRLQYWLRHRQVEADITEELENHRAMHQARLEQSGMSAADAAYASQRVLGNVTLSREDARSIWVWPWLDGTRQDAAYGLRALRRNPGFAGAVILVTSLGIGATTGVFGMLDALVFKPLPVREPDRLVYLRSPSFSYPVYAEVRSSGTHIFSSLFAWNLESVHVEWSGELEPAEILMASGDFYSTLGVQAVIGRTFTPDDDRIGGGPQGMVAVISHRTWLRRFGGDPSVVGRALTIDRKPFTIVGVTPRGFFGVAAGLAPDITIPLSALQTTEGLSSLTSGWLHIMGRLRDGVTHERADASFQQVWPSILRATTNPGMPADRRALYLGRRSALDPGYAGFSRVRNQFADPLMMLLGLVGLLFAVACASAANLLLARGVVRRQELAVRLAIGASRGRLVRQLITESLIWAALGACVGMLLASWAGNALVAMMASREEPIVLDVSPNWRLSLFALGLTLVTVMVCSILPAFRATRVAPGPILKDTPAASRGGLRRWSIGKALVTAQVALTMVLLVGGALFVRSLTRVLWQDAGFDRDNVLIVVTDAEVAGYENERLTDFYRALQENLASIPGVQSTSLSMYPPISDEDGAWTQTIAVDGRPVDRDLARQVYFNAISPGYFATVGMRLQQGRDFTSADSASGTKVVIVNESLVRTFFPNENPIGRHIGMGRDKRRQDFEIVGIARDAKYQRLQEAARPIAYLPVAQQAGPANLFVEVRPAGPVSSVVESVRRAVRAVDGRVPLRIETVSDRIRGSLVRERAMAALASAFGCAALVLACAGLYGMVAYSVSRQSKEIGLRLALGATRQRVVWTVMRGCLILAVLGVVLGAGGALALGRFTRAMLYEVSATDTVSISIAGLLMLTVAMFAGYLPARRAARVDPVVAMRCD